LTVDINFHLTALAKSLIITPEFKQRVDTSISHLKENLWGAFQDRLVEVVNIGSYDRETFVQQDKEADVDMLVVSKKAEFKPETFLKQIREVCERKYSRSEIYQDHPTIVIDMDHVKFEIVPSWLVGGNTVKIPAPRTADLRWIDSAPKDFKAVLNKRDATYKGLIIPLIRIYKYWNCLNGKAFVSFELERFIVNKTLNGSSLRDYFMSLGAYLDELAKTDQQKKAVSGLKEKIRRLKALETNKIPEYIGQEINSFLPTP